MRRLLCLLLLSLGLTQQAMAGQTEQVSALLAQKFGVARARADRIAEAVVQSASKYSLPPSLLLAVIAIESRFKEKARGPNGATGLMQVVPSSHRQMLKGVKDLTEPGTNIEAGAKILHGYVDSAGGDVEAGLRSYGSGARYAAKVSNQARFFEAGLGETGLGDVEPAAQPPQAAATDGAPPEVATDAGSPVALTIH